MYKMKPLLLVEDDEVDALTVKRSLEDNGIVDHVIHMTNGEEALDYLRSGINERPSLILLDLNMPKMIGIEFLEAAKQHPAIRRIPVVVLTTSNEDRDILGSFKHSVAGYMVKPIQYAEFVKIIEAISKYWALSLLPASV